MVRHKVEIKINRLKTIFTPLERRPHPSLLTGFTVLCIIVTFSIIFSGPIWDIDLWWHLATGKYIAENKKLMEEDPFSYTSNQYISPDRDIVLKGYWLGQIIFFLTFKLSGLYGIIILRTLLLISIFLLIYVWSKKIQCNEAITLYTWMRLHLYL